MSINTQEDISYEYGRAVSMFPRFNSPHEGYAVLLEEVEELWEEVRKNPKKHGGVEACKERMKKEAIQVAAMAMRFVEDCCK